MIWLFWISNIKSYSRVTEILRQGGIGPNIYNPINGVSNRKNPKQICA